MKRTNSSISENQAVGALRQGGFDLVRQRIGLLDVKDKILMSMYYLDGCNFRRIARLLGVNECSVARRIRKITTRLLAGQYIRCLWNRQFFRSADLQIAKDYYVGGWAFRQIAAERVCSLYEVRRTIERIEAILGAVEEAEGRKQNSELRKKVWRISGCGMRGAIMTRYNVNKSFSWQGQLSEKAGLVCRMFGLTADKLRGQMFVHRCQLEINEGDIVYITGPSEAGKSVLLGELEKQIPEGDRINLSQIELSADRAVIDCIDGGFVESLSALNEAGLRDVYCVLGRPALLSEGQQWRFRLAGSDVLDKKIELLNRLREDFGAGELAKLLPQTKKQIEALVNLKIPDVPSPLFACANKHAGRGRTFGIPLVFYVSKEQLAKINQALSLVIDKAAGDTLGERKANALMLISEFRIKNSL